MTNPGAATTTTTTFVGGGQPAVMAQSASAYLAFFGTTFTSQPSGANQAAVATTAAITAAGSYGFANAGQANGIVTLLNQIRGDLVTLGLIKGSS